MDVLVLDDNEIERAGRELVLQRLGHRADARDWRTASAAGGSLPAPVDVVLAVLRRDLTDFDRWACLRRIDSLSQLVGPGGRVIALAADLRPASALARLRLAHHGVDELRSAADFPSGQLLDELVRSPGTGGLSTNVTVGRLSVGRRCDPDAVIAHVLAMAERNPAYVRAFEPGVPQNGCGLSRRQAHTLRVKVAILGDLHATAAWSGGPVRDLSLPRWSDMVDFVNRCRVYDPFDDHLVASEAWATA